MLAEIFMLRLEVKAREGKQAAATTSSRFVPVTLPDTSISCKTDSPVQEQSVGASTEDQVQYEQATLGHHPKNYPRPLKVLGEHAAVLASGEAP